jgi:uncharacterized protein (DUF486 family)
MDNKKGQNVWWIWLILGLLTNLLTGSGGLLNKTGLILMALGIYEFLSQRTNKWVAVMVVVFGLLFYDYFLGLLAGEIPR